MEKLNPCYQCGSTKIEIMGDSYDCDVSCGNCGLTTNVFSPGPDVEKYAAKHWNEKNKYEKWNGNSIIKRIETVDCRHFLGNIDDTIEYLKEIKLKAEKENLKVYISSDYGEIQFEYCEKETE